MTHGDLVVKCRYEPATIEQVVKVRLLFLAIFHEIASDCAKLTLTEEFFSKLHILNKKGKLRIMQFLVKELTLEEETKGDALPKSAWPPNYFVETYGALRDDPITRLEQGTFEVREELE